MSEPITVLVTGAAGQIAYSLLASLANGSVFGAQQPVVLHLLDIPMMEAALQGVVLELEDCSFPLLKNVVATTDETTAFKNIDYALLVGAMPRREGMERKDLLRANVKIFRSQGAALDAHAKKSVKVLVVGNPANTNCLIAKRFAPSLPAANFSALTRLDQNRAEAQVMARVGETCAAVRQVCIWGNHSSTQFPDLAHGRVRLLDGSEVGAPQAVNDEQWTKNDFLKTVQGRGATVIQLRKLSSAMSAAKAICDHVRDWHHGTAAGKWASMAVFSDGSYNIEKELFYSFPLTIDAAGKWSIVQDLPVSDWAHQKMSLTETELMEERDMAIAICEEAN